MMIRRYSELSRLPTLEERFQYLQLNAQVGAETFGFDRYLNQLFYRTKEWRMLRNQIIIRDNGMEMGLDGFPIGDFIIVHHMNPITIDDIINVNPTILDSEFLVCVSDRTHKAIHYGDISLLPSLPVERRPGDTCPWK